MKYFPSFIFAAVAVAMCSVFVKAQEGILWIHVVNTKGSPVSGIVLTTRGPGSTSPPTTRDGKTRIRLAPGTQPGNWIPLTLANVSFDQGWVIVDPRDGFIQVPPFNKGSSSVVLLTVIKKANRSQPKSVQELLKDPKVIKAIAAGIAKELRPRLTKESLTEDLRRSILAEQAEAYGLEPDEVDRAIRTWGERSKDPYEKGLARMIQEKYPEASRLLADSLRKREREEDSSRTRVAEAAFFLGQSLYQEGKYREAADAYQKAADRRADDSSILNGLGLALHNLGDYTRAELIYNQSLRISENKPEPSQVDIAETLNNLAALYNIQGRYAKAENLFKRSLEIRERALGPDHPDVATSLNNLANLYYTQKRYVEAEPLFKRSLALLEKAFGPAHQDVATSLNNLAALFYAEGKLTEAESTYKQALRIFEKTLGPTHPNTANTLINLGVLYFSQKRYAEAESLYKRALAIFVKELGPDHPDIALTFSNLADVYLQQNKYAEAESHYKQALQIFKNAWGSDHLNVAASLNGLAGLYYKEGRYAEAEPLYKQSLAIFERVWGPNHLDVAITLESYAALLRKLNRQDEAQVMETRAKDIRSVTRRKLSEN